MSRRALVPEMRYKKRLEHSGRDVDQKGNLYVAEVDNGRVQKFRPRAGANPNYLMAKPVVPVWQSGT